MGLIAKLEVQSTFAKDFCVSQAPWYFEPFKIIKVNIYNDYSVLFCVKMS